MGLRPRTQSNRALLDSHEERPAPVDKRVSNASFLSGQLANVGPDRLSSLLRETRGTGLGGQDKKPKPKIEPKPWGAP